ncbi:unnamed protein product [Prorocentrum cordatum]|uniref:Uncharacterized protein n=1 Tax=Prorocentrum cordatum TaxID=2364126 RepID=A0ABN9QH15_9DINO|nr:unnamed protein product [Polarella glacialis]
MAQFVGEFNHGQAGGHPVAAGGFRHGQVGGHPGTCVQVVGFHHGQAGGFGYGQAGGFGHGQAGGTHAYGTPWPQAGHDSVHLQFQPQLGGQFVGHPGPSPPWPQQGHACAPTGMGEPPLGGYLASAKE